MEWNARARATLERDGNLEALTHDRQETRITTQVYFERLKEATEGRLAIYRALPIGKTYWKEPMEDALTKLHHQFVRVSAYAEENDRHDYTMIDPESVERRRLIREALYYNKGQTNDEIARDVADAIKVIEGICQPVLLEISR